ncbi:hypothetical protein OEB99_01455 [Actinotalea sp. M2MS4P-6]|uniref:hypothetical protein n=1 Tax=Actinotalea sp. M2MS4P-6 TaxID=2983762 RepID=UPI0021E4B4E8|nr:hypothetical protein [Actinotalea sp. M2MS4P-6]MCV2392963.1 hypothetical protein [Actinotalea sp. M2MS4P-6]
MKKVNVWFGSTVLAAGTVALLVFDPGFGLFLVAVLGAVLAGQLWSRAAARRRVDDGVWRARIWEWRQELLGPARRGLGWLSLYATVDVVARPDGLVLTPSPWARRLGHRARTVAWTDVVSAAEGTPSRSTPDGRLSFTTQTPIEIVFTGQIVPLLLGPDGEEPGESRLEAFVERRLSGFVERHQEAIERHLDALEAKFGPGPEPGTLPVTLTSDTPSGLTAAINARARGVPL